MLYQCESADVKFIITDNAAYDVAVEVSNALSTIDMVIIGNVDEAPEGYSDFRTMTSILSERWKYCLRNLRRDNGVS